MDGIDTTGGISDIARLASSTSGAATSTPAASAPTAVTPAAAAAATTAPVTSDLIALLADAASPIDTKKVEAIQSLIASGAYPINPHAIAAKMLALDFPKSGVSADA